MQFHFLDCELDIERCELRRAGEPVALRAKVFQLLLYLIEQRHRRVPKDELLEAVWPGRIIAEATLNSAIKTVRQAVGDDGQRQRVIQTLRGLGYRFVAELDPQPDADSVQTVILAPAIGAMMARPALAVLPFANLSGDPEQDYFSDGLTEDLITVLAASRSFPVIARNSTFVYKNQAVDVKRLGYELGVRYLVEGSVQRAGQQLRITAQLIDTETGHHVWAERYDRALEDVFALQDEITQRISAVIAPEIEQAEFKKSAGNRTGNLSAWDYYLRGMALLHAYTCSGNRAARVHFEQALALDASYCDSWIGLAYTHLRDIDLGCVEDRATTLASGFETARRALALDGASSAVHLCLGQAHVWAEQFDLAVAETETAVKLNPNNAHACMALGNRLDLAGRTEEGIAQMECSLRLNPRDPNLFVYLGYLARAYVRLGDYDTALARAQTMVRLRPDHADAHFRLAICLGHLNCAENARAALTECERLRPGYVEQRAAWQPYPDAASNEHFFTGLRRLGLIPSVLP